MSEPPLSNQYTLIFANGDLDDGPAVQSAITAMQSASDRLLIAADGGARHALHLGLTPHLVIGDFDSLTEDELDRLRTLDAELCRYPAHKDETDLELALLLAVERGANPIRVIGGIGDRLDQTLANVYLLALPQLRDHDVRLVSGKQTAWLAYPGETLIRGQPGDTLSLLPLGGPVEGIRTDGLEYPLRGETLAFGPARGISNVLQQTTASIRLDRGTLLLIHTIGRA
jgi:thiamine pyrophosphokinase